VFALIIAIDEVRLKSRLSRDVYSYILSRSQYAYDERWSLNKCVNDANLIESFIATNFATPFICRLHNEAAKRHAGPSSLDGQ
jgi:hypothetical protein